jgi:hypothetical protein
VNGPAETPAQVVACRRPLKVPYCDNFLGTSKRLDEPPVIELSECHYLVV